VPLVLTPGIPDSPVYEIKYWDSGGDAMYRTKITWRIQLPLSDDPRSRALFHATLADQLVSAVRLIPGDTGSTEITGEVIVKLAQNEGLGTILEALHVLSPRVFVSCADFPASPTRIRGRFRPDAVKPRCTTLERAGTGVSCPEESGAAEAG
jgi:hypothetical protein